MAFNKTRHTRGKTLNYVEQTICKWDNKIFSVGGILDKQNKTYIKIILLFFTLLCTTSLALEMWISFSSLSEVYLDLDENDVRMDMVG